jgi:hypothetical protein
MTPIGPVTVSKPTIDPEPAGISLTVPLVFGEKRLGSDPDTKSAMPEVVWQEEGDPKSMHALESPNTVPVALLICRTPPPPSGSGFAKTLFGARARMVTETTFRMEPQNSLRTNGIMLLNN